MNAETGRAQKVRKESVQVQQQGQKTEEMREERWEE